jgi:ubiquinone/menaquinone biosynthesis C-methylase UbiE
MTPKQIIKIIFLFIYIFHANYAFAAENEEASQTEAVKDKSRFLLATINEGNFPNIGGMEEVSLVLDKVISVNSQLFKGNSLEIGGGYGGIANFLKIHHNYAKIQAIDLDEEAVKYAQENYPDIAFKAADATKLTNIFENDYFDFAYMFDVAHGIVDKLSLLQRIKHVSKQDALLAIIDYNSKDEQAPEKVSTSSGQTVYPLNLKKLIPLMEYIGWEILETADITDSYKTWYSSILEKINSSKNDLLSSGYSEAEIKLIQDKFNSLLTMINEGKLGGIIIIARKL